MFTIWCNEWTRKGNRSFWGKDMEVSRWLPSPGVALQSSNPAIQNPRPLLTGLGKGRVLRMPRIQGSLRERLPAPPGARACVHGPGERALRAGARLARRAPDPWVPRPGLRSGHLVEAASGGSVRSHADRGRWVRASGGGCARARRGPRLGLAPGGGSGRAGGAGGGGRGARAPGAMGGVLGQWPGPGRPRRLHRGRGEAGRDRADAVGQTTSVGAEVRDRVAATCTVLGRVRSEPTESTEGPEQTSPKKLIGAWPTGPGLGILGTRACLAFSPWSPQVRPGGVLLLVLYVFQVPSALQGPFSLTLLKFAGLIVCCLGKKRFLLPLSQRKYC